jgi:hypothetical protein
MDNYAPDGTLVSSLGRDLEVGRAWNYGWHDYWFGSRGVFAVFHVKREHLEPEFKRAKERLLEGEAGFSATSSRGDEVSTRGGTWRGQPVTVLHMDRTMPNSELFDTVDAYLDTQGRLVGLEVRAPAAHGGELVGAIELVEYDVEPPADLFTVQPPAGVPVSMDFAEPYRDLEEIEVDYWQSAFGPRYLVSPSADWRARAFSSAVGARPSRAVDGDLSTYWTGRPRRQAQEPGMWFEVKFEQPVRANKALVHSYRDRWAEVAEPEAAPAEGTAEPEDSGASGGGGGPGQVDESREGTGWPAGVQVAITTDGTTWEDVLTGQAAADLPVYANFGGVKQILGLRLTLTQTSDQEAWSIAEVRLFGPPDDTS